jgi:hypothetical protein
MKSYAPALLVLLSPLLGVCRAADPGQVPESLLACSRLTDSSERVRCYDRQIAAMKAAAGSHAPATPGPAPGASAATAASGSAPAGAVAPPPAAAPTTGTPAAQQQAAPQAAQPPPAPAPQALIRTPQESAQEAPTATSPAGQAAQLPTPVPNAAARQPSYVARFGVESMPEKQRPKTPENERVLHSRITSVQEVRPKVFVITLANGQVWVEEGTQRAQVGDFFRAGYNAQIERGRFGSYRLSTAETGTKNWVSVRRIL